MNPRKVDMVGVRQGSLVVIEFSHIEAIPHGKRIWKCRCDCGNFSLVRTAALRNGMINSCGCSKNKADERNQHALHDVWRSMKHRCNNSKASGYKNYGGRGIQVCERWNKSYIDFYTDVVHLYKKGLQLDRINNDGNYEPSNIRWVSSTINMRNKRGIILSAEKVVEIRKSKLRHIELSKKYGVALQTIRCIRCKGGGLWVELW